MPRYIEWDDVVNRYASFNTIGGADEVNSATIIYAEAEVDSRLGAKFSLPFSNNNLTVKDLCIELTYIKAANINIEERKQLMDEFESRIEKLNMGALTMVVDSGASIVPDGDTVYSNTKNYQPVFDLGSTIDMEISSEYLYDLENAKL